MNRLESICLVYRALRLGLLLAIPFFGGSCEKKADKPGVDPSNSSPAEQLKAKTPPLSSVDLHHLRSRAKVHSERDTVEGFTEAARHLAEVVGRSPETAQDRLNLARVLVFVPDRESEAAPHLEKARALWGESAPPAIDYLDAIVKKRERRLEEGVPLLEKVTRAVPNQKLGWYQLGFAQFSLRNYEAALAAYDQVLSLDPTHRAAAYRRVLTLGRLGRTKEIPEAKALFKRLKNDPEFDTEKCRLTQVDLRPHTRLETSTVELTWTLDASWTEKFAAANPHAIRDITALYDEAQPCTPGLAWVDVEGARALDASKVNTGPFSPTSILESTTLRFLIAGDLDNDGVSELAMADASGFKLFQCRVTKDGLIKPGVDGKLVPVPPHETYSGFKELRSGELFDVDHDGDLDLIVGTETEWNVRRNNGNLTFSALESFGSSPSRSDATLAPPAFDAHDLDQASDIDFIISTTDGPKIRLNRRTDGFVDHPWKTAEGTPIPLPKDVRRVRVEDLSGDGAPDVILANNLEILVLVNADRRGKPYDVRFRTPIKIDSPVGPIRDVQLADVDHDTDLDMVVAGDGGVAILRNRGAPPASAPPAGETATSQPLVRFETDPKLVDSRIAQILTVDIDGDCSLELITRDAAGKLALYRNQRTPEYAAWRVHPTGRADSRSSIGAVVEHFAGSNFQSVMIKRPGGVHLGIGAVQGLSEVDGLRVRWPQGIIQAITREDIAEVDECCLTFRQKEGLIASCPFLYVKTPSGWEFISDVVGIAPLDEWLPPGGTPHQDPEEWVRLDPKWLESTGGPVTFSITEELRETTYLDRVELHIVPHAADVDVFVDESTRQERNEQSLTAVIRSSRRSVVEVTAPQYSNADATDRVRQRDGRYLHGYEQPKTQWDGWVPRYSVDFSLAAEADTLLLRGRIAWYNSTTVFALHQHGREWGPLRLERLDSDGNSTVLIEDLGLPSGMDRMMVAHWGERLPAGTRLRLSGHHRFLWDCLESALRAPSPVGKLPNADIVTSTPRSATLGFHGYSATVGDVGRHEQGYRYENAEPSDEFPRATGWATRYGDVTPLLQDHDDHIAVLVAGDKVEFTFAAPPRPAAGSSNAYFLRISGWCKEGSFHNRTGREIGPLPFRNMGTYPPRLPRPEDTEYKRYRETYQTRPIR